MTDQDPAALFWCWTENEPSTFHCRERGHDVRPFAPGTPVGASERASRQSTFARLRQAEAELGSALRRLAEQDAAVLELSAALAACNAEMRAMRLSFNAAFTFGWQVARNDDTPCARCGAQILRGYAVEPMPGTTKGSYAHIHCPSPDPAGGAE